MGDRCKVRRGKEPQWEYPHPTRKGIGKKKAEQALRRLNGGTRSIKGQQRAMKEQKKKKGDIYKIKRNHNGIRVHAKETHAALCHNPDNGGVVKKRNTGSKGAQVAKGPL